jgi:hypothetical protein
MKVMRSRPKVTTSVRMNTHIIGCPGESESASQGLSSCAAFIISSLSVLAEIDPYRPYPAFSLRYLKQVPDLPVHRRVKSMDRRDQA